MTIVVSKHALKRYKERIIKKKSSDGKKCIACIKRNIKKADNIYTIDKYNDSVHCSQLFQNVKMYHTPNFRAIVGKQGHMLYVVTILEKDMVKSYDRKSLPSLQKLS